MRATADVISTVDQHLCFYATERGAADRVEEVKALRQYEGKLLDLLELQVANGDYAGTEAKEVIDMLSDYSSVQSPRYGVILSALSKQTHRPLAQRPH